MPSEDAQTLVAPAVSPVGFNVIPEARVVVVLPAHPAQNRKHLCLRPSAARPLVSFTVVASVGVPLLLVMVEDVVREPALLLLGVVVVAGQDWSRIDVQSCKASSYVLS